MVQNRLFIVLLVLTVTSIASSDEPTRGQGVLKQRVSPKLLREASALPEYQAKVSETPVPVSLEDLQQLSDKLKKNGDNESADLLQRFIHERQTLSLAIGTGETWEPLIQTSVSHLLDRETNGVRLTPREGQPSKKRICFLRVDNYSSEEIGDFGDQIYQKIDTIINESEAFELVNVRLLKMGLQQAGLRPDDLYVPKARRKFAATMGQENEPIDYVLYATITSGTTRSNQKDYQRDYLFTLELVNVESGKTEKETAEIRKAHGNSAVAALPKQASLSSTADTPTLNIQIEVIDVNLDGLSTNSILWDKNSDDVNLGIISELRHLVTAKRARIMIEYLMVETKSGETARYVDGGEFLAPVPPSRGTTVEIHEIGKMIEVLPTRLHNDRVHLELTCEISAKDTVHSIIVQEPCVTKHRTHSTIEINVGEWSVQSHPSSVKGHQLFVLARVTPKK